MFLFRLAILFSVAIFLVACQPKGDTPEMVAVKAANTKLESDVSRALDSKKQAELQMSEIKEELTRLRVKLENAEADRNKIEEALKKLEGEFTEYKDKYKTTMRSKVPGYPLGEFTHNKRQYHDTVVTSITNDAMTLSHPSGIVRVERADIPAELVAIFALNQTTPIHASIQPLLNEVAQHKKGIGLSNVILDSKATPVTGMSSNSAFAKIENSKNQDMVLKSIATINTVAPNGSLLGSESGFIVEQSGSVYFYTNAHVVSASENLKVVFTGGQSLELPREMEISDEPEANDLVRFLVVAPKDVPVLQMPPINLEIKSNAKIIALGNSGGAGVIPVLRGRVKAMGPYAIEVDAEVIKGNSGGPVVFEDSNTVLGVVTRYQPPSSRDMGIRGTQFGGLRRICLRPDQVTKWKQTTLKKFVLEEKQINQISTDNELFYELRRLDFTRNGIGGVNTDALATMDKSTIGPVIATQIVHVNTQLKGQDSKISPEKRRQIFGEFVVEIRRLFSVGITGTDAARFSHFYREYFQEGTKDRDSLLDPESTFYKRTRQPPLGLEELLDRGILQLR